MCTRSSAHSVCPASPLRFSSFARRCSGCEFVATCIHCWQNACFYARSLTPCTSLSHCALGTMYGGYSTAALQATRKIASAWLAVFVAPPDCDFSLLINRTKVCSRAAPDGWPLILFSLHASLTHHHTAHRPSVCPPATPLDALCSGLPGPKNRLSHLSHWRACPLPCGVVLLAEVAAKMVQLYRRRAAGLCPRRAPRHHTAGGYRYEPRSRSDRCGQCNRHVT